MKDKKKLEKGEKPENLIQDSLFHISILIKNVLLILENLIIFLNNNWKGTLLFVIIIISIILLFYNPSLLFEILEDYLQK